MHILSITSTIINSFIYGDDCDNRKITRRHNDPCHMSQNWQKTVSNPTENTIMHILGYNLFLQKKDI